MHASDLTKEQYRDYLKVGDRTMPCPSPIPIQPLIRCQQPFWISVLVYTVSLNLTKISILQQYLRFLVGKPIRRACWILMWIVVVYTITATALCIFTCYPVSYFWEQVIPGTEGHCVNELGLWFANATFNIISDVTILILPMRALYQIHLPKRQKLGLILVFAMGFLYGCPLGAFGITSD